VKIARPNNVQIFKLVYLVPYNQKLEDEQPTGQGPEINMSMLL